MIYLPALLYIEHYTEISFSTVMFKGGQTANFDNFNTLNTSESMIIAELLKSLSKGTVCRTSGFLNHVPTYFLNFERALQKNIWDETVDLR